MLKVTISVTTCYNDGNRVLFRENLSQGVHANLARLFFSLQHFDFCITSPLKTFEMIITPDVEYPLVCVNVRREPDTPNLKLDLLNLNTSSSWLHSDEMSTDPVDKSGKKLRNL